MGQINWASIEQTLADVKDTPFAWGTHDCAIVSAEIILRATGVDYLAPVRGLWSDEASALKVIGGSLIEAVDRVTGLPKCSTQQMRMLDLCVVKAGPREALGVNVGQRIAVPGKKGLVLYPLNYVIAAWRVIS